MTTTTTTTAAATAAPRPRFCKINDAARYASRSRGRLYELAHQHPLLFRKDRRSTLVDMNVLDSILDGLPAAKIAQPWRFKQKATPQSQPRRRRRRASVS
jgi:hypothetical protein